MGMVNQITLKSLRIAIDSFFKGPISKFLNLKSFVILNRLSVLFYMLNPLIIILISHSAEKSVISEPATLLLIVIGYFFVIYAAAIAFTVFIQYPLTHVVSLIFNQKPETKVNSDEIQIENTNKKK